MHKTAGKTSFAGNKIEFLVKIELPSKNAQKISLINIFRLGREIPPMWVPPKPPFWRGLGPMERPPRENTREGVEPQAVLLWQTTPTEIKSLKKHRDALSR